MPKIILHIFNSDSKSVTFGWVNYIVATVLFVFFPERFLITYWQTACFVSAALVGGKVAKETMIDLKKANLATPAKP